VLRRQLYGVAGATNDVDLLAVVPGVWRELAALAGKGSVLHQRHKLYLDPVTVATPPENDAGTIAADVCWRV
jgi:hypothetical protein